MNRIRLVWKIFFIFLLVIIFSVVIVGEFALHSLRSFYLDSQKENLLSIVMLARHRVDETLPGRGGEFATNKLARELSKEGRARITIVLPDGRVNGDSEEDPARMENHSNRPEIEAALHGRMEPSLRFSHTLSTDMLYLAVPVIREGQIVAIVRAARSLAEIEQKEEAIRKTLWRSCLLGVLVAGFIGLYFSRRISRPIEVIRQAAERYARGDFSQKLFMPGPPEYVSLAKAMNRMGREMDRRLGEITRQRNEREAILTSMREGVLAVDLEERIIMLNPSAEALLGVRAADVLGQVVQETLRHAELQHFLRRTLAGEAVSPEEGLLHWPGGKLLQVESAPLQNEENDRTGLLLVLSDVTRLNRLENLRRDFVANVSHELRTPITSIKGFIETLREGAINEPENASRFLEIAARQADRLNAIIEDLLALSRIEREADKGGIALSPCKLKSLLETTIQHLAPQSAKKEIRISLECPDDLTAQANAPLLEQAVGNLLDNAIKYSSAGKEICVAGSQDKGKVLIRVTDEGGGIPAEHLPRLFERFYRVDPGRSRAAGGTGLGLAIVKHIVQAHGGQITVQSEVGKGSTFVIELPNVEKLTNS